MGWPFDLVPKHGGFTAQKFCIQRTSRDGCRNQGQHKRDTLYYQISLILQNISGWCSANERSDEKT